MLPNDRRIKTSTMRYVLVTAGLLMQLCCAAAAQDCLKFSEYINQGGAVITINCVVSENGPGGAITVPEDISKLTNLEELILRNSNITGSLPNALNALRKLRFLDLRTNLFTGLFPTDLSPLSDLVKMRFGFNTNLAAGIVAEMFESMTNLELIDFRETNRIGTLPSTIDVLTKLRSLHAHSNNLSGTLSNTLASLPLLTSLFLHDNIKMTGTIPRALARPTLTSLKLSNNAFSGRISDYPFDGTTFAQFRVDGNRLYGSAPQFETAIDTKDRDFDILPGAEFSGNFIADSHSCKENNDLCSAGQSSCSPVNEICCGAVWDAPHVRETCSSGECDVETGECVVPYPTISPTLNKGQAEIETLAPFSFFNSTTAPSLDFNTTQATRPEAYVFDSTLLQVTLFFCIGAFLVVAGYMAKERNNNHTRPRMTLLRSVVGRKEQRHSPPTDMRSPHQPELRVDRNPMLLVPDFGDTNKDDRAWDQRRKLVIQQENVNNRAKQQRTRWKRPSHPAFMREVNKRTSSFGRFFFSSRRADGNAKSFGQV